MKRLTGWEQRLHAATRAALRTPYRWGVHDCALFAADCVRAMTGVDLADGFRGRYDDEDSAIAVLRDLGCDGVDDLPGRWLGEIAPAMARRGDVVLFDGLHGRFLAICDGATAVGPAARGIAHHSMSSALRAWAVA